MEYFRYGFSPFGEKGGVVARKQLLLESGESCPAGMLCPKMKSFTIQK